jgi:V-type H+-transporting ATPase subunit C
VERIVEAVGKLEDDLKVRSADYAMKKQALQQVLRRREGSLAVRDLAGIVKPHQVLETENLCSVFVVVPQSGVREFQKTYERLAEFSFFSDDGGTKRVNAVVPRSADTPLAQDSEYSLFRLVVFSRLSDEVRQKCREKGYQVRDFKLKGDRGGDPDEELRRLRTEAGDAGRELSEWCEKAFAEAITQWMHLVTVRVFVESILRYGLPPNFQGVILRPAPRTSDKLRAILAKKFGTTGAVHWKDSALSSEDSKAGPGIDAETFPYVSFTVKVEV